MSVVGALFGLGLRATLGDVGESVQDVIDSVRERFEDHSQALPEALEKANDKAWRALAVALGGDGFLDHMKRLMAEGEARGLRERIKSFLGKHAAYFDQTPEAFRRACLAELEKARKAGRLSVKDVTADEAGKEASAFPYYSDSQAMMDVAVKAVERLADGLAPECPHLARLLRQPTPGGPPMIVSAFAFFFRREIETNDELSRGLTFESLRRLTAGQNEGFAALNEALTDLGDRFDEVMGHLGRIEAAIDVTRDAALAAHDAVLDMRAELHRLGTLQLAGVEEVRRLVGEAMVRAATTSEPPGSSRRFGSDEEEMTVRRLVARIRRLPEDQRRKVPALLMNPTAERPSAAGPRPGEVVVNSIGMSFAWIPPGSFLMGSPPEEPERRDDEAYHAVTLRRGMWLGVHPVTQAQWRDIMSDNPRRFVGADRPVERVSWDDCREFCERLSKRDGKPYRLPTEAEWEHACRAGTAGAFHFGAGLSADEANFDGRTTGDGGAFRAETTSAGALRGNVWGLCDMHGNVWEWCADWYGDYPWTHVTDPTGPATGEARVLRGGSWFSPPWYCRSACRYWAEPGLRSGHVGCRVCYSGD